MKFSQLFKLHFYAYLLWYILFVIISFLGLAAIIAFGGNNANNYQDFLIVFLIVCFAFSLFMGIYEYSSLCFTYLNLKVSRSSFYFSSIIHSIFNGLFITFILVIFDIILKNRLSSSIFNSSSAILLTLAINTLFYLIGSFFTLILQNIKYIKTIIYLLVLIIFSVFGVKIKDLAFEYIVKLYQEIDKLIVYLPIILGSTSILMVCEYLCFRKMDIKK